MPSNPTAEELLARLEKQRKASCDPRWPQCAESIERLEISVQALRAMVEEVRLAVMGRTDLGVIGTIKSTAKVQADIAALQEQSLQVKAALRTLRWIGGIVIGITSVASAVAGWVLKK